MSNTITVQPSRLEGNLYGADGVTRYSRGLGAPASYQFTDADAWVSLALTGTGTTVTAGHAYGTMTLTAATARINASGGTEFTRARYLRVWARRKPGATGAIAAQKICVKCWDGSTLTEIGRIYVSAVAAGTEEPICDPLDIIRSNTVDPLINFLAAHPLNLVYDAVDSDLEVCIEAYGTVA